MSILRFSAAGFVLRLCRQPLPGGLLGTLLLLAVIEALVLKIDHPPFATSATMNWRFARTAAREAAGCELLCFGDSQVQFELLPRVLQARTGMRAYNLALPAGPPSGAYFQLRRVLQAGARPRAVIVDFTPHSLFLTAQCQARVWTELLDPHELLDLARTAGDASFAAQVLVGQALPSYRMRYELRAAARDVLNGLDLNRATPSWIGAVDRNWTVNQGAQVLPVNPRRPTAPGPSESWLLYEIGQASAVSTCYMNRFLDLTLAQGIQVFWLLPPVHPAIWKLRNAPGAEPRYTEFVHAVQDRYEHVTVIDARAAGYASEVFFDFAHLDRHGAAALSEALGQVVHDHFARRSPPAEWVALPPYRSPREPLPIEDLEESRLALRGARL